MSLLEIKNMLDTLNIDVAYDHFNKKVINIILGNKLLLSRIEYLLTSGYSSIVHKTCEIIINKKDN